MCFNRCYTRANLMLANRINSITIRNFRSLADVTVELEDLTVLVGANGTGKSNFLNAVQYVRDVLKLGLTYAFSRQGNHKVEHNSDEISDVAFEIKLTLNGQDAVSGFTF